MRLVTHSPTMDTDNRFIKLYFMYGFKAQKQTLERGYDDVPMWGNQNNE